MPRAIELMKRREEEILKALKHLSKRTNEFSNPRTATLHSREKRDGL